MPARILIAGIGNIFLGDDAFGGEVVRSLNPSCLPTCVEARDFGIRGLDLADALRRGYDAVILVDTVQRGGPPGTIYVIEPAAETAENGDSLGDALARHDIDLGQVLRMVAGGQRPLLRLVGCEPMSFEPPDEGEDGLTPPVRQAVQKACDIVVNLAACCSRSRETSG